MSQTLTAKTSVILQGDTKDHLLNSAFLLGKLIQEYGTKDILVSVFTKDNKKQCDDIIALFKIDSKNVSIIDNKNAPSLFEKLQKTVELCCKNKIHFISMPNTAGDLVADPKGITTLLSGMALDYCNNYVTDYVTKTYKPENEKDMQKYFDEHKVSPSWPFQFMDDMYIKNNKTMYGLEKIFPDEPPKP